MSDIDVAAGRGVRDHRERSGLSQQELADKLGVGQSSMAKWERGDVPMRLRDAVAVCHILGIELSELWDEPAAQGDRYQEGIRRGIEISQAAIQRVAEAHAHPSN